MFINKETAEELVFEGESGEYTHIAEQYIDKHRWFISYLEVFQDKEGRYYGFHYMEPATEQQDGQDRFDVNSKGQVEVWFVEPHETVTVEWRAKK